jgi:hypothetical protein
MQVGTVRRPSSSFVYTVKIHAFCMHAKCMYFLGMYNPRKRPAHRDRHFMYNNCNMTNYRSMYLNCCLMRPAPCRMMAGMCQR